MSNALQTSWPGQYYDGRTATRHPVTVSLAPRGLEILKGDGTRMWWPYREVTQTQGSHADEPVRLEHGGIQPETLPEAVVVKDPVFLAALQKVAREEGQRFGGPPDRLSRWRIILLAAAGSIAAIAAIIVWGIPALAELATPLIPTSWEMALGESLASQLVPPALTCPNSRLRDSLATLVNRLAASQPASPYPFHVQVVDSPVFNAFAAPGGYIVVHRRLLESTETPEELAGVLAHEMQHVLRRHAMKALIRDLSTAALVGAVFGDVSGIGAFATQAARTLTTLHYSREAEAEADREGLHLLQAARINPEGMVRFFETLKKQTGGAEPPAYLSTHPETEGRLARMRALAAASPIRPEPLLTEVKWDEVKKLCR
jgi:Zn-dependent protease with chaperone function